MFPDLNPTENLWSVLEWKVEQQNSSCKEQLKKKKKKTSEHLSTDLCKAQNQEDWICCQN